MLNNSELMNMLNTVFKLAQRIPKKCQFKEHKGELFDGTKKNIALLNNCIVVLINQEQWL